MRGVIAALLALVLVAAQDAPPVDTGEDIVVQAKVGPIAYVFDKAADGRLYNCRVFISSGIRRVDARACGRLPECVTADSGETYCGDASGRRVLATPAPRRVPAAVPKLDIGGTITAQKPSPPASGPAIRDPEATPADRLGKLPPPPRDTTSGPAIRLGNMEDEPR